MSRRRIPLGPWRRDPLACREFVELVTDYLDGALPRRDHARFEAHVRDCAGCSAYLDQVRRTVSVAGRLPSPPDPETRAALLRAFRDLR